MVCQIEQRRFEVPRIEDPVHYTRIENIPEEAERVRPPPLRISERAPGGGRVERKESKLYPGLVARDAADLFPQREAAKQMRKVHSCPRRQRKGSPEPRVDFHQSVVIVLLELHHRDPGPAELADDRSGLFF